MAASIIDALVITLGLDTSDYDKNSKKLTEEQKKQRDEARKTAKEMEAQGKRAASFFSSIKTELLALAGVSLTVGGLTTFVKSTTNSLMQLSVQSEALGISARSLDGWVKSAEAAGSSAEKITGTLGSFQNAIQAFKSGDASSPIFKALALLNADTGTNFDPSKQNPEELLKGVAGALRKEKSPDRARYIAEMLGIDDATLQSMRSGTFVSNAEKYKNSSGVSEKDIENAKRFNAEWTTLQQKLEQTGYYVFNSLSPYVEQFNKYLMDLSDWVNSHPKEIHDAIKTFFDAVSDLANVAGKATESVGGWKNALEILIGLKVASWVIGLTGAVRGLMGLSLGKLGVAGVVGYGAYEYADWVDKNSGPKKQLSDNGQYYKDSWVGDIAKFFSGDGANSYDAYGTKPLADKGNPYSNNYLKENLPKYSGGDPEHQKEERLYWEASKRFLSKITDLLVTPAGAAEIEPKEKNYQPNVPLDPVVAKLGAKGKALLDMMTGSFGKLEGQYGLPAGLLRSVATTESGGDPYAKSKAGAEGLFQFMPGTAKDMGLKGAEVNDPAKSAEAAAKYLSQLLSQTGGDLNSALAAYNWGIGNVKKKGLENAPAETRSYIPKVLAGLRPGSGMAVDNKTPMPSQGASAPQYHFGNVTVTSPAQSVGRLTEDIARRSENRVRVLAFNSGQ